MKRITNIALALAVLFAGASCVKTNISTPAEIRQLEFDSWVQVHYPDAYAKGKTALGSYIIEIDKGNGKAVGDSDDYPFICVKHTERDMKTLVVSSTKEESVAKQIGTYAQSNFYGFYPWYRADDNLGAGDDELLALLNEGGHIKALVPGWLRTAATRYDTLKEYIDKETSSSHAILELWAGEQIEDITEWELDSIDRYVVKTFPEHITDPSNPRADTLVTGFYLFKDPEKVNPDTTSMPSDTTVFINYIGRLTNGQVFDTNIADTAKKYGLYSSSSTYSPSEIKYAETYTDIKMVIDDEESDVITGFSYALFNMRAGEAASAVFYSTMGYSYSGSGDGIPPYAPLRFDIELVADPEE